MIIHDFEAQNPILIQPKVNILAGIARKGGRNKGEEKRGQLKINGISPFSGCF